MSLILNMISKEEKRIIVMMNTYKRQMGSLPKGTLSVKKIGNNEYYLNSTSIN